MFLGHTLDVPGAGNYLDAHLGKLSPGERKEQITLGPRSQAHCDLLCHELVPLLVERTAQGGQVATYLVRLSRASLVLHSQKSHLLQCEV